jgi:hypothetical protein
LELPGISRRVAAILVATVLALLTAAGARAAGSRTAATTATDPNAPVLVTSQHKPPAGYRLSAAAVEKIAARVPKIRAVAHRHRGSYPAAYTKGPGRWQVSWFTPKGQEIAQVYIDDASRKVTEAWTGFQVAWSMARGYAGAFGRRVNAWYVWLPLCLVFVAPFLPWRRRPSLLHLDLLALLAFSVSLAFFNHALIGISVPLAYPFLAYLLARMLFLARGRGLPRDPLRLLVPASWLGVAVIFLVGFRIGLNVTNSNVIDVGYAGVIGADKLIHDKPLYGHWPHDNPQGDTYGPVNYYAYVPARALLGWSGTWDDLPAAHATAIIFDLLTLIGLFLLGRRVRGPTLGIVLAYAWAAYPFTLYALSSNSNDSLVAMLIVLALLVVSSAPARGVAVALAGLTKFAPLALGPLFLRGTGPRVARRSVVWYVLAFALTAAAAMLPVLLDDNLRAFWHDTVSYQEGRGSPFSVWGLYGGLRLEQHLVQGGAVALAIAVAFFPTGRRTVVQVAALGAAVVIALQLAVTHWFYLYIVWFFPLVMVALLGRYAEPGASCASRQPADAVAAREPRALAATSAEFTPGPGQLTPGAGSSTCSIDSARMDSVARTTTAFSHGSSVEVSNLTGICVAIASIACSRLTPITPPRGPVMPTSVIYAVPPGSTRRSAVGTCV